MKTNGSDHEAVFAAAAHHLIAKRCYSDAIELLRACHHLARPENSAEQLLNKLNTVRDLCIRLFSGYTYIGEIQDPELAALRRSLRKLNQEFSNRLKRRGKKIKTIYDILPAIEKHPAMYVGRPSLELLCIFLSESLNPHKFTAREWPSFGGFQAWVDRRYRKVQGGSHRWDQILIRAAGEDGPKAINLFFKELRQYRRAMA